MDFDPPSNFGPLNEIRNRVLLLSLGNAYLCEEPFLRKIGRVINLNVEKLKGDITSLKKRFPGKFVDEVETDEILNRIDSIAQHLQNPDKEINEKCTVGELGRELEESINAMTHAINAIRIQVEGDSPVYTKTDSILGIFGWLRPVGNLIATLSGPLIKLFILLILAAILIFSYLSLTMEKEGSTLKEIAKSEAYILSQREILSQLDLEKEQISREIKSMEERDLSRQDKIEIMDLEVGINNLDDKRRKIEAKISMHDKKLEDNSRKIKEIRKKSFIKRLLRQ